MSRYNIGIIGTSRATEGDEAYRLAFETGRRLIDYNFRLLTGGKSGVMEAASKGARNSESHSDGDIIGILPGESKDEANQYVDIPLPTGLGHTRNNVVARADALVAVGGGAGTLSELALGWIHNRLLIAFQIDGWSGTLAGERIDNRTRIPEKKPETDRIFGVENPEQVISILTGEISNYTNELDEQ